MKVARTVRRGEVGKGLSCETTCRRQAGLRERRYLAGPLPYLHHLFVLWGETGDPPTVRSGHSASARRLSLLDAL